MAANPPRTVLLVDDDHAVLAVLQQTLLQAGYLVLTARNGKEALGQHDQHRDTIEILITDLQMPEMSGQELASSLLQVRPALPIIFISGEPGGEPLPCKETFPNQVFLSKPFLLGEFIAQVENCLSPQPPASA